MVIYEVNLDIQSEIYDEYQQWLMEHVQDILQFEGFQKAEIGSIQTEEKNHKIRINYFVDSYANLQKYISDHAPVMRAKAFEKFGNKFSVDRRVILDPIVLLQSN